MSSNARVKRLCSDYEFGAGANEEDIRLCQSQPEPAVMAANQIKCQPNVEPGGFCFSQPPNLEDLLLSTQLHSTQSTCSQVTEVSFLMPFALNFPRLNASLSHFTDHIPEAREENDEILC